MDKTARLLKVVDNFKAEWPHGMLFVQFGLPIDIDCGHSEAVICKATSGEFYAIVAELSGAKWILGESLIDYQESLKAKPQ